MCVCMYIRICMYMCTVYVCMYVCTCVCTGGCTYVCICVCMHVMYVQNMVRLPEFRKMQTSHAYEEWTDTSTLLTIFSSYINSKLVTSKEVSTKFLPSVQYLLLARPSAVGMKDGQNCRVWAYCTNS